MAAAHDSALETAPAPDPGPPVSGAGAAEPPAFGWRRHEILPASWSFELQGGAGAPAVARAAVGRVLSGRLPENARRNVLLLVSETVSNSVLHGGAGAAQTVELSITVRRDHVRVEVADPIGGFEAPQYPADPLGESGRGLPLVHSLSRTWGIDGPPGGHVWFEMQRAAA
jgi:anti-sigma regulatory factor (Ser/Thr protein kinase)